MLRRPPRSTRTDTRLPDPALFRSRMQRRAKRRDLGPRRVGRIAAVKQEEGQRRIGLRVLLEIAVEIIKAADDVQPVGLISQLQFLREIIIIRSEEHTSELQSLMRISYAVFCL